MKFKLPKIKILHLFFSLKYLYSFVFIIILAVFAVLAVFLYNNFYQTITQSQQIIILKQEVSPDVIDTKKVEKTLGLLEQKTAATSTINWEEIKNPFVAFSPPAPAPPSNPPSPPAGNPAQ